MSAAINKTMIDGRIDNIRFSKERVDLLVNKRSQADMLGKISAVAFAVVAVLSVVALVVAATNSFPISLLAGSTLGLGLVITGYGVKYFCERETSYMQQYLNEYVKLINEERQKVGREPYRPTWVK